MKYQPCADAAFRSLKTFCGYHVKCGTKTNARLKELYDIRDGTTCSITFVQCPC